MLQACSSPVILAGIKLGLLEARSGRAWRYAIDIQTLRPFKSYIPLLHP